MILASLLCSPHVSVAIGVMASLFHHLNDSIAIE